MDLRFKNNEPSIADKETRRPVMIIHRTIGIIIFLITILVAGCDNAETTAQDDHILTIKTVIKQINGETFQFSTAC